jgi:hypothetical protein
MEIHLPFFALRKISTSDGPPPKARGKLLREPTNLSFLKGDNNEPEAQENYRLYPTQISCVVHGFDEWQWTTYAFVDTEHKESEDWIDGDDDRDSWAEVEFSKRIIEDPIACGQHAHLPVWKPRQYFLKVFEIRIKEIRQEWDQLVHKLVTDISAYVRNLTLSLRKTLDITRYQLWY